MRVLLIGLGMVGLLQPNVEAQAPAPPAVSPPKPAAATPAVKPAPSAVRARPPKDATAARPERERQIYVPYEDLEKVFQKDGRGVFLPYREFLDLWQELTQKRPDEKEVKPPVAAAVTRAEYAGRVEEHSVVLDAVITVQSFQKGWTLLPLVEKGTLGVAQAETGSAVLRARADGLDVLLPDPGTYELRMKILAAVTEADGKRSLELELPRAAVSRVTLLVPGSNLEFEVTPAAAFSAHAAPGDGSATEFSAVLGDRAEVRRVSWGAGFAATDLEPLILAKMSLESRVHSSGVETEAEVDFAILRAPVQALRVG
ncbi:MAG: hypothetical protein KDK99_20135, partial [Verrucomicrobiales bacterium]|nr:hypothetical protein [Verrucomicrobiales bacterium]